MRAHTLRMALTAAPRFLPLPAWITVRSIRQGSTWVQDDKKSAVDETERISRIGTLGCMLVYQLDECICFDLHVRKDVNELRQDHGRYQLCVLDMQ